MCHMKWLKAHDKYAASHSLKPATCLIWRILGRSLVEEKKAIINLKKINIQVQEILGKKYDVGTLKTAIAELQQAQVITIHGNTDFLIWNIREITLHSILQKKFQTYKGFDPNFCENLDKPQKTKKNGIEQQQLICIDRLCRDAGLRYRREDLYAIAIFGVEAVKSAIALLKVRQITSNIANPEGWLRRCLQKGWCKDGESESGLGGTIINRMVEQYKFIKDWLLDKALIPSIMIEDLTVDSPIDRVLDQLAT